MSITRVQVRRRGNATVYMPAWMVGLCDEDAVIISIVYEGERRPTFGPNQTVLKLTDEGRGVTPEMFHTALRFAREHQGKIINVHCHQGQQRSKTIARQIATVFPNYVCLEHKPSGILIDYDQRHNDKTGPVRKVINLRGLNRKKVYGVSVTDQFIAGSLAMRKAARNQTLVLEDSDFMDARKMKEVGMLGVRPPELRDTGMNVTVTPILNKETN